MKKLYKISKKPDSDSLETLYRKNKGLFKELAENFREINKKTGLSKKQTLEVLEIAFKKIHVPILIFGGEQTPLEAVVAYLKESGYRYSEIASLLNRDDRTIWVTYDKARSKVSVEQRGGLCIPIDILARREFSILENLCLYCIEKHDLSVSELARLIHKQASSMWTVYRRALAKRGGPR